MQKRQCSHEHTKKYIVSSKGTRMKNILLMVGMLLSLGSSFVQAGISKYTPSRKNTENLNSSWGAQEIRSIMAGFSLENSKSDAVVAGSPTSVTAMQIFCPVVCAQKGSCPVSPSPKQGFCPVSPSPKHGLGRLDDCGVQTPSAPTPDNLGSK